MIGGLNNGWAVANTTLMAERAGLGTGGSRRGRLRVPGSDRGPARRPRRRPRRPGPHRRHRRRRPIGAAQSAGEARQGARQERRPGRSARSSRSSTRCRRSAGCSALRMKSRARRTGGEPNIAKLMMSDLLRLQREVGNEIIGAVRDGHGHRHARRRDRCRSSRCSRPARRSTAAPTRCSATSSASACSASRRSPGPAKDTPFSELLVNK